MSRNIRKVLVANRGEIAVRVMATCRKMGIATVAVYSDADAASPHLDAADERRHLGGAPAAESYLNQEKVIAAAAETGADAIHPGYGFLSENPNFVEAVERAGITFIGPPSSAIRLLGDKTSAKAIARELGVPVVPGTTASLASAAEAASVARSIGYPVLLKAAAGGGGKGMRVVRSEDELASALTLARSEAASSFSDDRVYMEKYLTDPRHVEVQILADSRGSVIHLGERECSIQRRHQKIIEESPSPGIDDAVRAGIAGAAVRLAARAGYSNAGTVEFILDAGGRYYFMEVNARLQVEHPVTEARTGLDLVEEQIRIASGEPLSRTQEQIRFEGHAVECRVYAEDSTAGFAPSTGTIRHILHPAGDGVRIDTGIRAGSVIGPYYDPMISKIVTHAPTRGEAIAAMLEALDRYEIYGVRTNIGLLQWILSDPEVAAGRFDTNTLARRYRPEIFERHPDEAGELAAAVAGLLLLHGEDRLRAAADGLDRAWVSGRAAAFR